LGFYYIETWRPLLAQPLDVVSEMARRWDGGQEGWMRRRRRRRSIIQSESAL
jgi:hypothetical protein